MNFLKATNVAVKGSKGGFDAIIKEGNFVVLLWVGTESSSINIRRREHPDNY